MIKGFKAAKAKVIEDLRCGNYAFEGRDEGKNLLRDGKITAEATASIVAACHGLQYVVSPHHAPSVTCNVHIFKPVKDGQRWLSRCTS